MTRLGECILLAILCNAAAVMYKAAVVELPAGTNTDYAVRKELLAEATVALAHEAAQAGAQIIVFPEYGLIGFANRPFATTKKAAYAALFDEIPEPNGDVPCLNPDRYANAPTIVTLSCGARNSGIAIVGALGDIVRCPNEAYPGCAQQPSDNKTLQFNTAVAFDTDGTFLQKYHKTNFWGEDNYLDVPQGCEDKTFTTSFGVKFGLFICADAFYDFPTERLLSDRIKNFVTPIAWSNYMAHMQAMSWHQGWSLRNCANIVFANLPWNYGPASVSTGSGMMSCGQVKASYYLTPPSDFSGYVGEIIYGDLDSDPMPVASTLVPSLHRSLPTGSDVGPLGWQFAPLASGKVCSDTICCFASDFVGDTSGYSIAALGGVDSGCGSGSYAHGYDCGVASLHWPAEVCGVFLCTAPNAACLDYRVPTGNINTCRYANDKECDDGTDYCDDGTDCEDCDNCGGNLKSVRLEMTVSPGTVVYPHSVAHGASSANEQILLAPGAGFDFVHNDTFVVLSVDSAPHPITSAVMYGRRYQQDNLTYSCPGSRPEGGAASGGEASGAVSPLLSYFLNFSFSFSSAQKLLRNATRNADAGR
jgi:predicted amidohydrolase